MTGDSNDPRLEDVDAIAELLNRSSFGSDGAKSLRRRGSPESVEQTVRQSVPREPVHALNRNQRRERSKGHDVPSTRGVMFHLFGPVEASMSGTRVELGTERERRMVVPLLLAARRPVSYLELADWMWNDSPSSTPDELGQCMGAFRFRLAQLGLGGSLANRDRVCRLNITPGQVDLHRLTAVVAETEQLDDHTAARRLRDTLALCTGEPLHGMSGHRIDSCRQMLLDERRRAEVTLIRVNIRLGRAALSLPDLMRLFWDRPEDTVVAALITQVLEELGPTPVSLSGLPLRELQQAQQAAAASQAAASAHPVSGAPIAPAAGAPMRSGEKTAMRRFGMEAISSSQWFGDTEEPMSDQTPKRRFNLQQSEEDEAADSVSILDEEHESP